MAAFPEGTDGCRELPGKSPLRVRPLNPSIPSPLMGEGKGGGEKEVEHTLAFLLSPSPLSPPLRAVGSKSRRPQGEGKRVVRQGLEGDLGLLHGKRINKGEKYGDLVAGIDCGFVGSASGLHSA